jgi:sugar lactone lactonase YvrE
MKMKLAVKSNARLGEGPLWDWRTSTLHWVDIEGGKIHSTLCLEKCTDKVIDAPPLVSSLGLAEDNHIILSAGHGIFLYEGSFRELAEIKDTPRVRFNDGKCSPEGDYWIGTMDMEENEELGKLYVYDGKFKELRGGLIISNGMDWFKDSFYLADSPRRKVYGFKVRDGGLEEVGVAVDTSPLPGVPDGITVDQSGTIWVAHYGGGMVSRWEPFAERPVAVYEVPVKLVTSLTFGGDGMEEIFITTSSRAGEELGGSLFVMNSEVKGRKANICRRY